MRGYAPPSKITTDVLLFIVTMWLHGKDPIVCEYYYLNSKIEYYELSYVTYSMMSWSLG